MSHRAYVWRRLTPPQRESVLKHRPHIGLAPERMSNFTDSWLALLHQHCEQVLAWCVLPNHYHALIQTPRVAELLPELGRFHGRTSRRWNTEEGTLGRSNFYRCFERAMRSEAHQWVTINYIHHNPVHHGYVQKWTEWPWSSVHGWLEHHDREALERQWRSYPLLDYGQGWDDADL